MGVTGLVRSVVWRFKYCLSKYDLQLLVFLVTFVSLTISMVLVLYYYYPVKLDYWFLSVIPYTYAVGLFTLKSKFLPGRLVKLVSNPLIEKYAIFLYIPPSLILLHVGYKYAWVISSVWVMSRLLESFLVSVLIVMIAHLSLILAYVKNCIGGASIVKA